MANIKNIATSYENLPTFQKNREKMGVGRGEKVILEIYFYAERIPQHFSKLLGIKNLRVKPLKIRILI